MERNFLQKQRFYRGRAKIRISSLQFDAECLPGTRTLDVKNIERLCRVFQAQGCQRLDPDNHIAVLIPDEVLTAAIASSNITRSDLFDISNIPPHLVLGDDQTLRTLHGQHRVEAGRRFLNPADCWWIAELYSTQLPEEAILELRTQFPNARGFKDGDIFRYLSHYQLLTDEHQIGKWESRLSKNKLDDVTKLVTKYEALTMALDALLPFVGFWAPLPLGALGEKLKMGCEKELVHYVERIHEMWSFILTREANHALLDIHTVESLQLLYPQFSAVDRTRIVAGMTSFELFPNIRDLQDREIIKSNLLRVEGRILSLSTFFDDTKYLKPCARIIKKLLPAKETSLYHALTSRLLEHQEQGICVQVQEFEWKTYDGGVEQARRAAYLQLWLFAMRNSPFMHKQKPRKDSGKQDNQYEVNEDLSYELGQLAHKVGFRSLEINKLRMQDPLEKIVCSFIYRLRPIDCYNTDSVENELHNEVDRVCQFLHSIPSRHSLPIRTTVNTDMKGAEAPSHRCGRPFESSYLANRRLLFLHNIYDDYTYLPNGKHITSFGVTRDIFICFFGYIHLGDHQQAPGTPPRPTPPPCTRQLAITPSHPDQNASREKENNSNGKSNYEDAVGTLDLNDSGCSIRESSSKNPGQRPQPSVQTRSSSSEPHIEQSSGSLRQRSPASSIYSDPRGSASALSQGSPKHRLTSFQSMQPPATPPIGSDSPANDSITGNHQILEPQSRLMMRTIVPYSITRKLTSADALLAALKERQGEEPVVFYHLQWAVLYIFERLEENADYQNFVRDVINKDAMLVLDYGIFVSEPDVRNTNAKLRLITPKGELQTHRDGVQDIRLLVQALYPDDNGQWLEYWPFPRAD